MHFNRITRFILLLQTNIIYVHGIAKLNTKQKYWNSYLYFNVVIFKQNTFTLCSEILCNVIVICKPFHYYIFTHLPLKRCYLKMYLTQITTINTFDSTNCFNKITRISNIYEKMNQSIAQLVNLS